MVKIQRLCLLLFLVFASASDNTAASSKISIEEDESIDVPRSLVWWNRRRQGPSQYGPYKVAHRRYRVPVLDKSGPHVDIVFPKELLYKHRGSTKSFPLLLFLHGSPSGGLLTYWAHLALLRGVASFGFIVAAPRSCCTGCPTRGDFSAYYDEALKVIDWIHREQASGGRKRILGFVNKTVGYGIFGHSRGGPASVEALVRAEPRHIYEPDFYSIRHPRP